LGLLACLYENDKYLLLHAAIKDHFGYILKLPIWGDVFRRQSFLTQGQIGAANGKADSTFLQRLNPPFDKMKRPCEGFLYAE